MSKRSDAARLFLVLAVAMLGTTAATCQNPRAPGPSDTTGSDNSAGGSSDTGKTLSMIILHRAPSGDIDTVDVDLQPIRQGISSALPEPASVSAGVGGALRQYVNVEQNGRIGTTISGASWKVRWSAALRERNIPRHILQSGGRIVVESPVWELFDMKGKQLWALAAGISPLVVEPAAGHIYFADANGTLLACRLEDGREVFSTLPLFADEFVRPWLSRHGNRMVIVGVERGLDPEQRERPSRSIVELIDLGSSPEVSASGLLASARNISSLIFETTSPVVAGAGDSLVIAMKDHLFILDGELNIVSAFAGSFSPMSISLDEARRIYLAVTTETGSALWILSPSGELLRTIALPGEITQLDAPPAIGYDHSVYIRAAGGIIAFAADGKQIWEYRTTAPVAGMTVTTDNRVLVSAGSDLSIIDRSGSATLLRSFEAERLATAPIVTATGDIVVASESMLYMLMPGG